LRRSKSTKQVGNSGRYSTHLKESLSRGRHFAFLSIMLLFNTLLATVVPGEACPIPRVPGKIQQN
jgi:hypothetical protein